MQRLAVTEAECRRLVRENYELRQMKVTDNQLALLMQEQLESLRAAEFGASTERYEEALKPADPVTPPAPTKPRVKKPSERYPNLPIKEHVIVMNPAPLCPCCSKCMTPSGMSEESEQLTVIPKKYEILKILRAKYRCSCHGPLVTAPSLPRIIPGSTYSDEMILDVGLSKYCDLLPIERYAGMAARGGVKDLPTQSLIELTHGLADFLSPVYTLIRAAVLGSRVLHADETPHKMLEGSSVKNWYLWGFSTPEHCFLECRNTRSGDVASDILVASRCEVLVTDVYSGYGRGTRIANEKRREKDPNLPQIRNAYCNAHARRYFFKCWPKVPEAKFYLDEYQRIYALEAQARGQPPERVLELRAEMRPRFEAMRSRATLEVASHSDQSKYGKALQYLLSNYAGLTLCLGEWDVALDNNSQERLLRSHVVGRKTWYGTHSERGALTSAILFTLVESCKLCGVNPREYFLNVVRWLHRGEKALTPADYAEVVAAVTSPAQAPTTV